MTCLYFGAFNDNTLLCPCWSLGEGGGGVRQDKGLYLFTKVSYYLFIYKFRAVSVIVDNLMVCLECPGLCQLL